MATTTKVALVTGAGSGIGQATALRLGREGYRLAVVYGRSAAQAAQTTAAIVAAGGDAKCFALDVTCEQSVARLFDAVLTTFGRLDVLVNCAGAGHYGKLKEIEMADFDRLFALNTRGTFMMCRAAARCLQPGGRIINISTGATASNAVGQSLYVASKAALEGFSKVLARELGPQQIAVNVVSPGMTDTPLLAQGNADYLRQLGAKQAAMGRCGQPGEVADAIAALVGADGSWISGQVIRVDGGSVIV
ncbi:SDR family NAD(P)-dependent oxidoreductase [Ferrimonas pelagia]